MSAPSVLRAEEASTYAVRVLEEAGLERADALLCAEALVESSLRGIDSHGVVALLPRYADQAAEARPRAEPAVAERHGAAAVVDGRGAFGLRTARVALGAALELADAHGVGAVAARNVGYLGALWWTVEPAAERGMIGLAATNSMACVAPYGGLEPLHGTNPIAVAVPAEPHPILLDMRTNALRMTDYWESVRTGRPLPEDGIMRPDGTPTADPADIDDAVYLPLGVRGYGLALVVDVLTAALSGGPIGREVTEEGEIDSISAFFLALDPAFFGPLDCFAGAVARLVEQVHATAPLDPASPVRLPGARGYKERRRRLEEGIPVDPTLWAQMQDSLCRLGVAVPAPA